MNDALRIASLGLDVQRTQLDTIAQNVSNVNTPGFKRQKIEFSSLLDPAAAPKQTAATAGSNPLGQSAPAKVAFDFAQGEMRPTQSKLDVAIAGTGFIEVELEGARSGLVRGGSLMVREDGLLATKEGLPLKSNVRIPEGATDVEITRSGEVIAKLRGDTRPSILGQIQLVSYASTDGLEYLGQNVFVATAGMGSARYGVAGEDGLGTIRSGFLEASNVKLVDEMVGMMFAQRVYGLNSKVAQVADEMMGLTNNLRRS